MVPQQSSNSSHAPGSRNQPQASLSAVRDGAWTTSVHPPLHWEGDEPHRRTTPCTNTGSGSVGVTASSVYSRAPISYQSGRVWSHPSSLVQYEHVNSRTPNTRRTTHKRPLVLDASPRPTQPLQARPTNHRVSWAPTTNQPHPSTVAVSKRDLPIFSPLSPESPPMTRRHTKPTSNDATIEKSAAATVFARTAAHAGFLQKSKYASMTPLVGHLHVPERQQQRFFVVQPATHLYEFESAHDAEPSDCWDLDQARITYQSVDDSGNVSPTFSARDNPKSTSSTRHCITVEWDNVDANETKPGHDRKVLYLEARSQVDAELWRKALEEERLSHVKQQLAQQQTRNSALQSRISELERTVSDLRCIEQDRDGAVADAARYQSELSQLDEAIRQLVLLARRRPDAQRPSLLPSRLTSHDDKRNADEPNDETVTVATSDENVNDAIPAPDSKSVVEDDAKAEASDATEAVGAETEAVDRPSIDIQNVPSTHFSALYNAVDQLRENWRLASSEAATAVDDVLEAQERVVEIEKRMAHAETHLCQIWEDNCALRKALKQKKREKRVLVREIKNTRATSVSHQPLTKGVDTLEKTLSTFTDDFLDASDEEKLIQELEEHVISSIRLHEAFLASNLDKPVGTQPSSMTPSPNRDYESIDDSNADPFHSPIRNASRNSAGELKSPFIHPSVPLFEPLPAASLFDECDEDESDVTAEELDGLVSSDSTRLDDRTPSDALNDSLGEHPNPLLILNSLDDQLPQLTEAFSESESSRSSRIVHQATSTLSCPLADVITTAPPTSSSVDDVDGKVYHLTFYSRKIGIQFQRVPPPPTKARGLLTEAMTDELKATTSCRSEGNTASELRRIAAISTQVKSVTNDGNCLELARPVDAVLVCGFDGFDDTGSNRRPKLGARLVAFDGVSIEVGKWTFDAVRKAIQARSRPLTLSFRNDFLTTEQRTILTKAIQDVASATSLQPVHGRMTDHRGLRQNTKPPLIDLHQIDRGLSQQVAVSLQQAAITDDEISESATEGEPYSYFPQSFSGTRSLSSMTGRDNLFGDAHSVSSSTGAGNFRSFSEAGSSTASVLSAVAPLVSNLLNMRRRREPFTPEYLRRAPESVEGTPQHQDFQSELL